jgi:uroporphyrinogen decarboxylase
MQWHNRAHQETINAWIQQGAPSDIKNVDYFGQYFQLEPFDALHEIISGAHRADIKARGVSFIAAAPIVPVFEIRVLEEDDIHRVETTYGGQIVEVFKAQPWRMPRYIDHPVKDRKSWNEYKKRLEPNTPARWPSEWLTYCREKNSRDIPTCLQLFGLFMALRAWMGLENLLYSFFDNPNWIQEMMDHVLELWIGVIIKAVKNLRIDRIEIQEDIAYKNGPLISPNMVKEFMIPRYKRLIDLLDKYEIKSIMIDSDGNINELIPLWFDIGINCYWPLECAAGMDAVALRKRYGRELTLSGNIDKRVFPKGKEAIRQETMSKVPFLIETGGYFPCLDHSVHPDVSLENFRYFINLLREVGGLEQLPN